MRTELVMQQSLTFFCLLSLYNPKTAHTICNLVAELICIVMLINGQLFDVRFTNKTMNTSPSPVHNPKLNVNRDFRQCGIRFSFDLHVTRNLPLQMLIKWRKKTKTYSQYKVYNVKNIFIKYGLLIESKLNCYNYYFIFFSNNFFLLCFCDLWHY